MKSIFLADNDLYTSCWAMMCLSYHTLGSLNHSVAFWQNHPCLLLKVYHKCSRFERHIKTRPVDAGYILYCIAWFRLFLAESNHKDITDFNPSQSLDSHFHYLAARQPCLCWSWGHWKALEGQTVCLSVKSSSPEGEWAVSEPKRLQDPE